MKACTNFVSVTHQWTFQGLPNYAKKKKYYLRLEELSNDHLCTLKQSRFSVISVMNSLKQKDRSNECPSQGVYKFDENGGTCVNGANCYHQSLSWRN